MRRLNSFNVTGFAANRNSKAVFDFVLVNNSNGLMHRFRFSAKYWSNCRF